MVGRESDIRRGSSEIFCSSHNLTNMFSNFNQVIGYSTSSNNNAASESVSTKKNSEKILNSKLYYLNKSSSKFISVGLSLTDFAPRILIGGYKGFEASFSEEEWKSLQQYQGVIVNYFYCKVDAHPLKFGNINLYFEKINQIPIIKLQNIDGNCVCLASDTCDKLFEVQEIVDYRIHLLKRQEFDKYFNVFQTTNVNQSSSVLLSNVYNILNPSQNTKSENVCTMLEMLTLYPNELEDKLKHISKRKYYEEISSY